LFEQAESERQNLQTIVDTMPTGILVMNASGEVLLSNQNLQSLLGLKTGQSENLASYPIIRADSRQPYPREDGLSVRFLRRALPLLWTIC